MEKYDAVVTMGRNWRGYPGRRQIFKRSKKDFLDLNVLAKMNCIVVAEFYRQGKTDYIIFGTGKSAGENFPSESRAMKNYILKRYPEIPDDRILIHENNLESYQEIEEDARIAKEKGLEKLAVVTIDTQLPKGIKFLRRNGFENVDGYDTFQEIVKIDSKHATLVERYKNSCARKYERTKENLLTVADFVGFRGWFWKRIAKITRK